jgi:hypothetical protein
MLTWKRPDRRFIGQFHQKYMEQMVIILHQLLQKPEKERRMLSSLFDSQTR